MAAAAICAAVPSLAAEGQASLRSCGMRSVCGLSGISARDSLRTSVPADRRFLPTSRRIDRGINDICYAYKGEMAIGFAASYGTLTSDDTDLMLILDGIDMKGSVFTLNPSFGYFIKDNIWFHDAPAGAFRKTSVSASGSAIPGRRGRWAMCRSISVRPTTSACRCRMSVSRTG